jgi:hypothetical protein
LRAPAGSLVGLEVGQADDGQVHAVDHEVLALCMTRFEGNAVSGRQQVDAARRVAELDDIAGSSQVFGGDVQSGETEVTQLRKDARCVVVRRPNPEVDVAGVAWPAHSRRPPGIQPRAR